MPASERGVMIRKRGASIQATASGTLLIIHPLSPRPVRPRLDKRLRRPGTQLRQERGRVRTDLSEEVVENLDSKGWMRSDTLSLTRELAAETRALRMLHLPDTRTAAQKRRVMEARAASAWSAGASSSNAAALAAGATALGRPDSSSAEDNVGGTLAATEATAGASVVTAGGAAGAGAGAGVGAASPETAGSTRKGEAAEEGPGSLSPR